MLRPFSFGFEWPPPMQGLYVTYYDGALAVLWIGPLWIDFSYTRLAWWLWERKQKEVQ